MRKLLRRILIASVPLIALLAVAPWIVAKTPLRDVVVKRILHDAELTAEVDDLSLSWFSPVSASGVRVSGQQGLVTADIEQITLERPFLTAWRALPELGEIVVERPHVTLVADESLFAARKRKPPRPLLFTADVRDAQLTVLAPGTAEPLMALANVNVRAHVNNHPDGRTLDIDPVRIFDQQELSPELCDQGLRLITPALANATAAEGRVSLELTECHIPLDDAEAIRLRGELQLDEVTARLKDKMLQDIATLASALLDVRTPATLEVAATRVAFDVRGKRVHHDGFTFLLPAVSPNLAWQSTGSVGFDESLDLTLSPKVSGSLPAVLSPLAQYPFVLRMTATIDAPEIQLQDGQNWMRDFAAAAISEQVGDDARPLADALMQAIDDSIGGPGSPEEQVNQLLDRLRQRRESRKRDRSSRPRRRFFGRNTGENEDE